MLMASVMALNRVVYSFDNMAGISFQSYVVLKKYHGKNEKNVKECRVRINFSLEFIYLPIFRCPHCFLLTIVLKYSQQISYNALRGARMIKNL